MVGEKNMHSSSGCAIIRSIFPLVVMEHFPANLHHNTSSSSNSDSINAIKQTEAQNNILQCSSRIKVGKR